MRPSSSNKSTPSDALPPEDELVARLTRGLPRSARTLTGPGDDCAVIRIPGSQRLQLLKADAVVEGIHFTRTMPAAAVGRKALGRAVSDIASMGGTPCEALITLVVPPDLPWSWLKELYAGLRRAAEHWGVGVAGGETSSAPPGAPIVVSVALTGEVREDEVIRRDGARPGDLIVVTGRLGNSFASGWHLKFKPRIKEARMLAEEFRPTAMMDLSDGLAKDLPRLAMAGGVGWLLELNRLPLRKGATTRQALEDGEDYELLFTLPEALWPELEQRWKAQLPKVALTSIGTIQTPGITQPPLSGGWDHFAAG